ncbi:hypothetical protein E2I00_000467 [Balaenoptera physalus]|uniref:Immunoglobulin V-set domain-containing protein n=1 Tax=Balaenoptera physalus TaxID=9770 RepID=A0A6A1Q8L0_BALPH|nr:hypothetical protein E2I00_000467 [Balaenoptera physalus]
MLFSLTNFFFFLLDFISCDSQVIYGAVNKNVTLYASSFKPFKEIVWKRGKDKVVEWDDQSEVRAFLSFKGRVHLDTVSGNLTIFKLTQSDEDEYGIESPSVRNNSKFTLKVIESLPSPTLSCALTDGNITLQCMILEAYDTHVELIQYSWDCPSTIQCQSGSKPSEAQYKAQVCAFSHTASTNMWFAVYKMFSGTPIADKHRELDDKADDSPKDVQ